MKKYSILLLLVSIIASTHLLAQKEITLEDIWQKGTYQMKSVPGFEFLNDGQHYTRKEGKQIKEYNLTTGDFTKVVFDAAAIKEVEGFDGTFNSYTFSGDEQKLLIKTATEKIYRHSTRAHYFIYDRKLKRLTPLSKGGKQRYATFNPQADKVAFVRQNNLYYVDLTSGKEVQVTDDGQYNHIINGSPDWVYEEEFSFARAFEWSTDGNKIAFLRFDESEVKEFIMPMYYDLDYPDYYTFKYPKVGEQNAIVTAHIHNIASGKTIKVDTGKETDQYLPRIYWTQDPNQLCVFRLNRHQNHLELLLANAKTGATKLLMEETNKWYIDEVNFDNLVFLKDGKQFIWTSEMDGYSHIYLYGMNGKLVRQVTNGDFDVTKFYGVDEKNSQVFYQAAAASPIDREIYSIGLDGKDQRLLSAKKGTNSAQFSSTYDYFVLTRSDANSPNTYAVYDRQGKLLRTIEENTAFREIQQMYNVQSVEFFSFQTSEEVELNGYMIKPPNFNENHKYPVFMYVYGGPNSQTVKNSYGGFNYWWFQLLAQKGYIVVSVDNRGTGARGEEFRKMTYQQLGRYETIDQIEAAKYLAALDYTDPNRIGIFGWSYGGYMSSLALFKGNDVFKAAIAVAPVTNWKWYDTIYTERFMRTAKENPDGYHDNSPIYFADQLKGAYLLVHGVGDDNVHFQNSVEMANALIRANKQFDTMFYPNRNHGIYGQNARIHLYTKMTDFLMENL